MNIFKIRLAKLASKFFTFAEYKGRAFWIHKSKIHGSGIFAARDLKNGEDIGVGLKLEKKINNI